MTVGSAEDSILRQIREGEGGIGKISESAADTNSIKRFLDKRSGELDDSIKMAATRGGPTFSFVQNKLEHCFLVLAYH